MRFYDRKIRQNESGQNRFLPMYPKKSFYRTINKAFFNRTATVVFFLATGSTALAGDGRRRSPETDLAAPGAPLYEKAARESIVTLASKAELTTPGAAGIPPSPGPDYYWCKNCKAYHKKKAPDAPAQPAAQQGITPAKQPQADSSHPPSPGPGYYWCSKCKAFHPRPQSPGTPQASTPVASSGSARESSDYYYCEKCKVYHRRKPLEQQSMDVHHVLEGATNSATLNPPAQ